MSVLEVNDLSIHFGGLIAVNHISFNLEEGTVTSMIGPNGAGKTTTINLLTGFYKPDTGTILLDGESVGGLGTSAYAAKGFCRTFQNIRLFKSMTTEENVMIGMQHTIPYGNFLSLFPNGKKSAGEKEAREKARYYLKLVGLENVYGEKASALPYGMQRKLEIARALAAEPKVLMLDEPAAGMNPMESAELSTFIRGLLKSVRCILLIEHDMKVVMTISDKVIVINHGQKICEGTPAEVQSNEAVIEAYLGKRGAKHVS